MGQFGDKFRKAREAKEFTLDDVSNVTKISPRMLQAIEEENFDRLPGGVFNKGFIRAYAKHLGLNPEDAITEYLDCLHQAQVAAQQAWEPNPAAETASTAKGAKDAQKPVASVAAKDAVATPVAAQSAKPAAKTTPVEVQEHPESHLPREQDVRPARTAFTPPPAKGSSWRLVVIAALVFALGIALWTRRSRTGSTPSANANTPLAGSPPPSSSAPATPAPAPGSNAPASTAPATSAALLQSPPANSQPSGPNAVAPAPAPNSSLDTPSAAAKNEDKVEEKNDVTIRTFGNSAPSKAADSSAASFSLTIRAAENSWLSITADGQPVRQETLIAPAHTSVHATREIVVKVGNAAGVSFLLNGKEIPPQGNEAEPRTLVFDSSGLKTAP